MSRLIALYQPAHAGRSPDRFGPLVALGTRSYNHSAQKTAFSPEGRPAVADRPRILILGEAGAAAAEVMRRWPEAEAVPADSLAAPWR